MLARGWLPLALLLVLPGLVAAQKTEEVARQRMVREQIEARGIRQPEVLEAMAEVPRHRFVPTELRGRAYADEPLPIGEGQTISQPYVVALMTELLDLGPTSKVLEIGTGSGYHAAVMSRIASRVVSMEIVEPLADRARGLLSDLGYGNVRVESADGSKGMPSEGPYDAILLTAAPREVPAALLDQLREGGRLVAPVGSGPAQDLVVVRRTRDGLERRKVAAVRFLPMEGDGGGSN